MPEIAETVTSLSDVKVSDHLCTVRVASSSVHGDSKTERESHGGDNLTAHSDSNFTVGEDVSHETFRVMSVIDAASKQPLRSFGDDVEAKHGAPVHADTKVFVLRGGQSAKVRIRFRPAAEAAYRQVRNVP